MFIRTKRVHQNDRVYEYLLLVESERRGRRMYQRVIANLGRADQLDRRRIDEMITALGKMAKSVVPVDPYSETAGYLGGRTLGALPIWRRLWEQLGIGEYLRAATSERQAPLEMAAFAMVAARLMEPASKRRTFKEWLGSVYWPEFEGLSLQHLYRALDVLADAKDELEKRLWNRTQELFAPEVDLVLLDTTNSYFHGPTRGQLAQFGPSKEKRFDRRLVSIGLLATRDAVPIGHDVYAGNTGDTVAFSAMVSSLKKRFRIGRVVLCADRGMVSEKILAELREMGMEYVVGARPGNLVEDAISYKGANWKDVAGLEIRVKPMAVEGETYVVCYNPNEAEHDRKRRQEIVSRLRQRMSENPSGSSLLRNTSFRGYVRLKGAAVEIDEAKIQAAERYDGKYVLRSNATLSHEDMARAYRQLYQIERAFRDLKGPLELRPIRHFTDRRIRGHVMVCFLAYALEMALRQALTGEKGAVLSEGDYHEIMQDLGKTTVGTIAGERRVYQVRSPLVGRAHEAYAALGMRPPNKVLEAPDDDPKASHQSEM